MYDLLSQVRWEDVEVSTKDGPGAKKKFELPSVGTLQLMVNISHDVRGMAPLKTWPLLE